MSNKKKGISYYIRLDPRTFQSKLTCLFMVVAFMMLVILLIFGQVFHKQYQEQKYVTNTLSPSLHKVQVLNQLLLFAPLSDPEARQSLNNRIQELNHLANSWTNEQLLMYHEQLIDRSEAVRALAEQNQSWKESPDFATLNKILTRLEQALQAQYNAIQADHQQLADQLNMYLWASFIIYFSGGVIIAHLVIKTMVKKIKDLRYTIKNLAVGILPESIPHIPDEFDSTRKELKILSENLKSLTYFAKEVGQGNFNTAIEAFDQQGALGLSLSEMRDSLKKVSDEQVTRRWFNEAITRFADILRKNNTDIDALANEVISPLVKYLGAVQGALFVQEADEDSGLPYLKMRACYAYDRLKYLDRKIPAGNGLIGQAYLEREQIYLKEIPADYESITTGMGQGTAKSLILMPLMENDKIEGVVEIASLQELLPHQLEFLEKVSESIAAAIANVKNTEKTQALLKEAQLTAEQMGAQEEEMRQNMEEMQATQEEMLRAQKELISKEANLNAFINNTTDSIITITRDYKVGLINETLKARYKGTAYEGIKEGSDVLPTLGAVANEWKGYYDRAFAGERQDFTIKSSVQGEDSWRQYIINPIQTSEGEIVGASVLSRDISKKVVNEQSLKKKTAVLNAVLKHPAEAYLALDDNLKVLVATEQFSDFIPELETPLQEEDFFLQGIQTTGQAAWKERLQKVLDGELLQLDCRPENTAAATPLELLPLKDDEGAVLAILLSIRPA